ncbi:transcriptional regulator GcvA [Alsobacter sp. SYSU M60028]|uniref:Transcriptional regulator GcvA n=1 Tax=Alsobacter ponti TaxID=2962936 RepID=A0ABT1LCX8_9HYPH|nr:transcriptional regulator GcvA [Alsobacter ponti]MCP8938796.1 transcriptional regulator GcvA [Alsobacter ponti]
MNSTRIPVPSLGALQALEAASRHGSFTRAAEELNLTQGAVSRQIALLESELGVRLFERVRQRVALTPAGEAYAGQVREALVRLSAATLSIMTHRGAGGVLSLAILPTFGTRWLIPRLPEFFRQHPEITINFATRIRPFDFASEDLDAAIHFGEANWPGAVAHRLMGETIVPVASPALVAQAGVREPRDLLALPLLQQVTRPRGWAEWLTSQGLGSEKTIPGPVFEQFAMVAQAAQAGLGAAIVPRFLVEEELKAGTLVIPFDRPVESAQAYYLVYPRERRDRPPVAAFRDWLLAACEHSNAEPR